MNVANLAIGTAYTLSLFVTISCQTLKENEKITIHSELQPIEKAKAEAYAWIIKNNVTEGDTESTVRFLDERGWSGARILHSLQKKDGVKNCQSIVRGKRSQEGIYIESKTGKKGTVWNADVVRFEQDKCVVVITSFFHPAGVTTSQLHMRLIDGMWKVEHHFVMSIT